MKHKKKIYTLGEFIQLPKAIRNGWGRPNKRSNK